MKAVANPDQEIQSIDIKQYLFKIIGYWKLFVISIILALIITKIINIRSQNIYKLESLITVSEEQNPLFSSSTNIAFNWGGTSDKVETIITILQSRTHNEKVVDKLNFKLDYFVEKGFRKVDIYGSSPFLVEIDTFKYQLQNTDFNLKFLNNDEVEISFEWNDNNTLIDYSSNKTKNFTPNEDFFSQVYSLNTMIDNPFFGFKIINVNELFDLSGKEYIIRFNDFDNVVKKYKNLNVATFKKGTSIIELSFEGPNKIKIVDFLNMTVEVLREQQREQKIKYALRTKQYIDTLFKVEANSLKVIENDLGDFKQKNKIYDLSEEGRTLFNEITLLDHQREQALNRIQYLNNLEGYLESHGVIDSDNIPAPALVDMEDQGIVTSVNSLILMAKSREGLEQRVKATYPGLIRLNEEIKLERRFLLEKIGSLKKIIQDNLSNINTRMGKANSELIRMSPKEQKLLNFERKYSISETNYNYLKQKSYEAGTAIAANVSDIKVLDKAKDVGDRALRPNTTFNYLIGFVIGILLPLLFILIKEFFNNKFQTVEEIEKSYKIPILGVIGKNKDGNDRLVVHRNPNSTISESFRALRSNIQFLFQGKAFSKTVLVTSSVSGEGKTLCAANMATVFALSGKKTILLGLDLRKPKMHTDFEANNDVGIVNYLIGEKTIEEVTTKSKIDNLDFITSGPIPPNPSELIISDQTQTLFDILKKQYDYIVIDTPPVGMVADAFELFKYSDAIMYVIRQNYTQKGMLKMIDNKYENGEVQHISYVLNDFEVKNKYVGGYGYGYGYGYGKYGNGYHQKVKLPWYKTIFKKS